MILRITTYALCTVALVAASQEIKPVNQNAGNTTANWKPFADVLENWLFTDNFAVTVGNANGRLFEFKKGTMTLHTHVETASTSKWPIAMMMAGVVKDGIIDSLDDPVHKYLPWWTKDPADNRSYVTFAHLLSFTSGFGGGKPGANNVKNGPRSDVYTRYGMTSCMQNSSYNIIECAKELYNTTQTYGKPGTVYSYNSIHLQLAGGLVSFVTGLDIQAVLQKYLFGAYGMVETTCLGFDGGKTNPELAVCLNTTGSDYEAFLLGQLSMKVLGEDIVKASETDHTPFLTGYTMYGNYGFGHFLECFDSVEGFTTTCADAHTHIDPGAFGYYPLVDRKNGYYLNLVAYESGKYYPRSGIPEYLGVAIKPIVDAIIRGDDVSLTSATHHPAFSALGMADINYCMGCYVHPASCA